PERHDPGRLARRDLRGSRPPLDGRLAVPPGVPLAAEPPPPAVRRLPRSHRRALARPQRPGLPRAPRPPRRGLAARGPRAVSDSPLATSPTALHARRSRVAHNLLDHRVTGESGTPR